MAYFPTVLRGTFNFQALDGGGIIGGVDCWGGDCVPVRGIR